MTVYNFIPGVESTIVLDRKVCDCCGVEHPLTHYHKKPGTRDGLHNFCKDCRKRGGKKDSGIALRLMKEMRLTRPPMGTPCACCGATDRKLWLDHDHETMEFRGWICGGCNTGIGQLGDTMEGLERAMRYLKRDNPKVP